MSFLNIALRALSILIKFLSLAYITRGLSSYELDTYFLFISIAAIVSQIFGLQTFHIVMRRFNKNKEKDIIDVQLYQHFIVFFVVAMVITVFINPINVYLKYSIYVFILLAVSEILTTEVSRLFIVVGKSLYSNVLSCVNSLNYFVFGFSLNNFQHLFNGLSSWSIILLPTIIISVSLFLIVFINVKYKFFSRKFNLLDVFILIKDSKPYVLSQVLNLIIIYLSRFVLDYQGVTSALSYYSILHSFANVISVFLTVGIIAPLTPLYMSGGNVTLKSILLKTLLLSACSVFVLTLIYQFIVSFVGKPELIDFKFEFLLLLLSASFFSLSQVFQLFFLKNNNDTINLKSYFISGVVSVILSACLIPKLLVLGASLSYFFSSFTLLATRIYYFKKANRNN